MFRKSCLLISYALFLRIVEIRYCENHRVFSETCLNTVKEIVECLLIAHEVHTRGNKFYSAEMNLCPTDKSSSASSQYMFFSEIGFADNLFLRSEERGKN